MYARGLPFLNGGLAGSLVRRGRRSVGGHVQEGPLVVPRNCGRVKYAQIVNRFEWF
jgi:hypothetical protein